MSPAQDARARALAEVRGVLEERRRRTGTCTISLRLVRRVVRRTLGVPTDNLGLARAIMDKLQEEGLVELWDSWLLAGGQERRVYQIAEQA